MFNKLLIANRGEIALRILRACKELGIQTVAAHSTADADAMHVRLADESVCIGPPPARDSYLKIPEILAACEITGAEAVHPGYGFLSENARFAEILEAHSLTFVGPSAKHISIMGDKITAKQTAEELGIPVVPGSKGAVNSVEEAKKVASEIGYPVIVKAASGGGGRGMKVAMTEADIGEAVSTAKAEAKAAFGDDALYLEKYLITPRHIEIQVFGDGKGNAIHLGERDCSLQRRHQKIWEEALSPTLNEDERASIGKICADAVAKMGYSGAGTVEFLYENGEFYFIEMNTRLQVEHPVTEAVTGIDLVHEQLRVAAGGDLSVTQDDVKFNGHAIECRINAEHPVTFAPSPGTITQYHPPGGFGVRVDSGVYQGYKIPPYYDSLIGKLIVHGRNRTDCMMRLRRALNEFVVDGIETTIPLFHSLLNNKDIQDGIYDIHWLENFLANPENTDTV
ncbi:MAG: acetyl-CoA carboxylase biotin carboxylase subunit [Hyphomicrobiales bacterium]